MEHATTLDYCINIAIGCTTDFNKGLLHSKSFPAVHLESDLAGPHHVALGPFHRVAIVDTNQKVLSFRPERARNDCGLLATTFTLNLWRRVSTRYYHSWLSRPYQRPLHRQQATFTFMLPAWQLRTGPASGSADITVLRSFGTAIESEL